MRETLLPLGARCGGKYLARRMLLEGSGEFSRDSRDTGGGGEDGD
jgi:hypothetical protein